MKRTFTLLVSLFSLLSGFTQTVYFNETFDDPLTDGWYIEVVSGDTTIDNWWFDNPANRTFGQSISGNPYAIFDDAYTSDNTADTVDLISLAINMTGKNNSSLFFYEYFEGGFGGKGEVWVRTNDGGTWHKVYETSSTSIANPDKIGIDLQDILGLGEADNSFRTKFRWIGDGSFWWIIDDVYLYSSVQNDAVGVKAENLPRGCVVTFDNPIDFTVKNTGTNQLSSLTFNYQLNNDTVVSETVNFPENLSQDSLYTHTFPVTPTFLQDANLLKLWPSNPNGNPDAFPANDTTYLTTELNKLQVINIPFVEDFEDTLLHTGFCLSYGPSDYGRIYMADSTDGVVPCNGNISLVMDSKTFGSTIDGLDLLVNLSSCVDKILSFKYGHINEENDPEDGLFLSVDNGATFNKIYNFGFDTLPNSTCHEVKLNLDSIANELGIILTEKSLLKWQHAGNNSIQSGEDGFYLDDISIDIKNRQVVDATIPSIVLPEPVIYKDSVFNVSVYIKNNEEAVDTLVAAKIGFQFNNGSIVNEFWGGCLPPDDSTLFTFSNQLSSGSTEGIFELCLWIKMPNSDNMLDFEPDNDTTCIQLEVTCSPLTASFEVFNRCAGQSTLFNSTSPYAESWVWNFGDGLGTDTIQTPEYTYDTTGTYIVELSVVDAKGCKDTLQKQVDILSPPRAGFSVSSVCLDKEVEITDTSSDAVSWAYDFGDGSGTSLEQNPTYQYSTPGTYSIIQTIIAENGCRDSDTTDVNIYELPVANAGTDTSISCSDTIVLRGNGTGGLAPYNYYWSDGATSDTTEINTAGNYIFIVTDQNGCSGNDTVVVDLGGTTFSLTTSNDTTVCFGDLAIIAAFPQNGVTPYSYIWNTGQTDSSITVGADTIPYSVTVEDDAGCRLTDFLYVNQNKHIQVTLGSDKTICYQATTEIQAKATGGDENYSYLWSTAETTQAISVNAGSYSIEVTDGTGCTAYDTITVAENPELTVQLPADTIICKDDQITITAITAGGDGNYIYDWNTGESTDSISVTSGTYIVQVIDGIGCTANDTINIAPGVSVDAGNTQLVNCNETVSLTAIASNGDGNYSYLWSTGETTATIDSIWPGEYEVIVIDGLGCTDVDNVDVILFDTDFTISVSADTTICQGDTATLKVTASGGTLPYSYWWSTGDTVSSINVFNSGLYEIIVSDSSNCRLSRQISVRISLVNAAFLPSADTVYLDIDPEVSFTNNSTEASSYFWDFGNGTTSELVEPSVTYSSAGEKQVVLIAYDTYNCTDTASHIIHVFVNTGIDGLSSYGYINLYPNPAGNKLFVSLKDFPEGKITFEITSIHGVIIYKEQINSIGSFIVQEIDVNDFSPGLYLISIKHKGISVIQRIIIE